MQEPALNLREAHLRWYLNGRFHLSGRAQKQHMRGNKAKNRERKKKAHSTRGNILNVSAGTNLCSLIGLKLLKRRPAGTETGQNGPERSRDEI